MSEDVNEVCDRQHACKKDVVKNRKRIHAMVSRLTYKFLVDAVPQGGCTDTIGNQSKECLLYLMEENGFDRWSSQWTHTHTHTHTLTLSRVSNTTIFVLEGMMS